MAMRGRIQKGEDKSPHELFYGNNVLVKPIIYLFKGEYKGSEYRTVLTEGAAA